MNTSAPMSNVKVTEETGLTTRSEQDFELSTTAAEAAARYEMEGAIIMARRFPRNEDKAFGAISKACGRPTFAENCCYSFPRGGEAVEGPSVYLAREAARCWGNVRYGCDIIRDDENNRQIRGWAWDLETNTRVAAEDSFAKLVYRKKGGWVKPDERDLRELTNRRAAILIRNCILAIIPSDLIEDAVGEAKKTLEKGAAANPDAARKAMIKAFASLGIPVEELERYLKHPLAQSSPAEIAQLRTVYKSIADGNSKWAEYVEPKPGHAAGSGPVSADDLTRKKQAPAPGNSEPASQQPPVSAQQAQGGPTAAGDEAPAPGEGTEQREPGEDDPGTESGYTPLSDAALALEQRLNDPAIDRKANAELLQEILAGKLTDAEKDHLKDLAKRNTDRLRKK